MQDPLEFYGFLMPKVEALNMDASFLTRNVNEGFSGGEKKRNEILQLAVLEAEVAILDEIDSGTRRGLCVLRGFAGWAVSPEFVRLHVCHAGLDIDALRDVAKAVNGLKTPDSATIMVTHYKRAAQPHTARLRACHGGRPHHLQRRH